MTDDESWRRRRRDDPEDFGPPLFGDDPAADDSAERRLSFGPNDTGPLPHWTDPPTGEVPRLEPLASSRDDDEEVDVWSTFSTESPVWRDDDTEGGDSSGGTDTGAYDTGRRDPSGGFDRPYDPSGGLDRGGFETAGGYDRTGDHARSGAADRAGSFEQRAANGSDGDDRPSDVDRTGQIASTSYDFGDAFGSGGADAPPPPAGYEGSGGVPRGRITIGTDPSGATRRSPPPAGRRGRPTSTRGGRPAGPARTGSTRGGQRDLPVAIAAGLAIAAVFLIAVKIRPVAVLILVVVILGIAAWEFYGKVVERGHRPAVVVGMAACIGMPLAAYYGGLDAGDTAILLVLALSFIATVGGFLGASDGDFNPLASAAITMLGVVWIGVFGSFAILLLNISTFAGGPQGTDTLVLLVLGVAANDVGALAVGSVLGRTPLREWISPDKTIEGVLGGAVATMVAMVIFHSVWGGSTSWTELNDILVIGVVIAVLAPLGDLTESMFKRSLDVKDFGALVPGHGGVLDRFDSFLLVLPAVYYATLVLQ